MHQRSVSLSCHPHGRTRPATRTGAGEHATVRSCPTAKKESGSLVRGTQESDRGASLAPAEIEVRAGAVLPGSGGPEHQTTGAVPQSTDNTYYGSRLAEVEWNTGLQGYGEEFLPITDFFNTHLEAELADVEDGLSQARLSEIEVDAVLDFSEALLLNTAGIWERCSLDQKQRLQQVLFPQGVEYADGVYRTQQTSFLFKSLGTEIGSEEVFGSAIE